MKHAVVAKSANAHETEIAVFESRQDAEMFAEMKNEWNNRRNHHYVVEERRTFDSMPAVQLNPSW